VRTKDYRLIFLLALFVPYIVIFILSAHFFFSNLSKYSELKRLNEIINPVKDLSEIIILLNGDKVFTVLKTFGDEESLQISERYEREIGEKLQKLKKDLIHNKALDKYCSCGEIFNLDSALYRLRQGKNKDVKGILQAYDNLINELCAYYAELSSKLSLKALSLQFKTLYNLHKFHTVVNDLVAERLALFYQPPKGNPLYSFYYYRGEILAYADTFYVLIDFPLLKEKFKKQIFGYPMLQNLLKGMNYPYPTPLINDFLGFEREFSNFHNEILKKLLQTLEKNIEHYWLKTFEVLILAVVGLTSLLVVNFVVYQYGVSRFESTIQKLEERIFKDPLTGLLNRRFFNAYLLKRLKSDPSPTSFILLDLDNFKRINDTYGHDFGDRVLRHVARILRRSIRKEDIAVRWGGEEFGIFVKAPLDVALKLAERVRKRLEESPIDGIKITASFGVGEYKGEDPKEFFKKVDEALYRAKRKGKNRVEKAT
jgi:diguanylate cyclase (GGDEF)-like protein